MSKRRYMPEPGDVEAWRALGAEVVRCVDDDGVAPEDLLPRIKAFMPETRAVNVLAWLENGGYVRFDGMARRWRLTSSGRRLARHAA